MDNITSIELNFQDYHDLPTDGEIEKTEFDYLYSRLIELVKNKWKKKYRDKKEFPSESKGYAARLHGYGAISADLTDEDVSVELVLKKSENVKSFYKYEKNDIKNPNLGKFIYESLYSKFHPNTKHKRNRNKVAREKVIISKRLQLNILFIFFGYKGISGFRAHPDYKKVEELKDFERSKSDYINSNFSYIHYVGLYFSKLDHRIKSFILKISKEVINKKQEYEAFEYGYHDREQNPKSEEFKGKAFLRDGYLSISLKNAAGIDINILGIFSSSQSNISRATLQTVSYSGRLLSSEVMMIKISKDIFDLYLNNNKRQIIKDGILSERDYRKAALYLGLKRNVYDVSEKSIHRFSSIRMGNLKMSNFQYLEGTYRIWNFTFKRHYIVQSKFELNKEGAGFLMPFIPTVTQEKRKKGYTERYEDMIDLLRRQKCLLHISNLDDQNPKIWIVSYPETTDKPAYNMCNIAIFDYPERLAKKGSIIEGAFTSIGYGPEGVMSGYLVMMKDNDRDFGPEEFSKEQAKQYIIDHKLPNLQDKLYELWPQKIWKYHVSNNST